MSRSEKLKVLAGLIVWVLVGVVGFVYFWLQNPERKIRSVIAIDRIAQVQDDFQSKLQDDLLASVNGVQETSEAPTTLGGVIVSEPGQLFWDGFIQRMTQSVEREVKNYDVYTEDNDNPVTLTGPFALDPYQDYSSNDYIAHGNGDVRISVCTYLEAPAKQGNEEFPVTVYQCGSLLVGAETKTIDKFFKP